MLTDFKDSINYEFDYNRFCKPYITDNVLWEIFGDDAVWVKANCLQIEDGWVLRLKPQYTGQHEVEKMFMEGSISENITQQSGRI